MYLGHQIDEEGLHSLAEKFHAICSATTSKNVIRIEDIPGAAITLHEVLIKFVCSVSTIVLFADTMAWTEVQQKTFMSSK